MIRRLAALGIVIVAFILITLPATIHDGAGPMFAVLGILLAYFLPTIIGFLRNVRNIGSVTVTNFFTGWTGVGWVVALAMASRSA